MTSIPLVRFNGMTLEQVKKVMLPIKVDGIPVDDSILGNEYVISLESFFGYCEYQK